MPDLLGVLAHRRAGRRAHERVDHRTARRRDTRRGTPTLVEDLGLDRVAAAADSASRATSAAHAARRRARRPGSPSPPWSPSSARTTPRPRSRRSRRRPTRFAYISCGTWSLVGVELARADPDRGQPGRRLHERGRRRRHDRFLQNVMGLWLLQESLRTWERRDAGADLAALLAAAAPLPGGGPIVDPDDPAFMAPGRHASADRGGARRDRTSRCPEARPRWSRCILDSLAAAYARAVDDAARLPGRTVEVVHVVGGGSQNALLCQLTADACRLPVLAGPVEATALGNVLVQARSLGLVSGDLGRCAPLVTAIRARAAARAATYARQRTADRASRACSSPASTTRSRPTSAGPPSASSSAWGTRSSSPTAQTCCGQMHFNTGYRDECVPLVRTSPSVFEPLRRRRHAIAVVRLDGPPPPRDRGRARRRRRRSAADVARSPPRCYELSEFLVDVLGVDRRRRRVPAPGRVPPDLPLAADARDRRPAAAPAAAVDGLELVDVPGRRPVLRVRRDVRDQERGDVAGHGRGQARRTSRRPGPTC